MSERLRWHVVRTKPRQETIALTNLQRQGYQTFLPQYRTTIGKRRKPATVPLFPGYIFVGIQPAQQAYDPIRSTFGTLGLVRFGDRIPALPQHIIDTLRERERRILHPQATHFAPGDTVLIVDGPFAGLNGIFQVASGPERVRILLDLLGRSVTATVDKANIAPKP